ncbi:hypothetical protein WA158_003257 [Blastocystis sp. Blastoise]
MSTELRNRFNKERDTAGEDSDSVAETPSNAVSEPETITIKKTFKGRVEQLLGYVLGDAYYLVKYPHTITWLMLFLCICVTYFGFIRTPGTYEQDIKAGICLLCVFFTIFGALNFPNSPLTRPHPCVWKILLSFALIYEMFLLFLLCLTQDDARLFLKYIDPSLGVPLAYRDYASDCRVYTPEKDFPFSNVRDVVFDEFFLSHLLGWIAKALIFRDWGILWILSILFEVLEVSCEHILFNFKECWWDKVFADVLGCNFVGMAIGMWIVKKLQARDYHWVDYPDIPNNWGKMKRIVAQFTPMSWTTYKWNMFGSFRRYVQCAGVIILFEIVEMDAFFLKSSLYLEPPHYLNIIRLLIWFGLALSALTEIYNYFSMEGPGKRLGTYAWTAILLAFTEVMVVIKDGKGIIYGPNIAPMPGFVFWNWVLFIALHVIWLVIYLIYGSGTKTVVNTDSPVPTDPANNKKIMIFGREFDQKLFFCILPTPLLSILAWNLLGFSNKL